MHERRCKGVEARRCIYMKIAVGSVNPVKIDSVKNAIGDKIKNVVVEGIEVNSSVSDQPMSDEETKNGAEERAVKVLELSRADIGVGLEGGVYVEDSRAWNTVWCCVVDKKGKKEYVNGLKFVLPTKIEREILKGGEMGPVMDKLIGSKDIKKKQGAIGVMTDGWISREECYRNLVKIALGRLLSKEW